MRKTHYVAIMLTAIMAISAVPVEVEAQFWRDKEKEELREQNALLSTQVEEMNGMRRELDLTWQRIEQLEAENGQLNEQLNVARQLPNVRAGGSYATNGSDVVRGDNEENENYSLVGNNTAMRITSDGVEDNSPGAMKIVDIPERVPETLFHFGPGGQFETTSRERSTGRTVQVPAYRRQQ